MTIIRLLGERISIIDYISWKATGANCTASCGKVTTTTIHECYSQLCTFIACGSTKPIEYRRLILGPIAICFLSPSHFSSSPFPAKLKWRQTFCTQFSYPRLFHQLQNERSVFSCSYLFVALSDEQGPRADSLIYASTIRIDGDGDWDGHRVSHHQHSGEDQDW